MVRWMGLLILVTLWGCGAPTKVSWSLGQRVPLAPEKTEADGPGTRVETLTPRTVGGQGGGEVENPEEGLTHEHRPATAPNGDPEEEWEAPGGQAPEGRIHLRWPMAASGASSLFGARSDPVTGKERFHYGVDFPGRYGEQVRAIAPGKVTFAGWNHGHGRMVTILHGGGWRSSYSHLAQTVAVIGSTVQPGQTIGLLGNSGRSTGPHLHLEITRYDAFVDPLDVLGTDVPLR